MSLEESPIERCPHDKENPYTMISRDLIRNEKLSPECRWLIIYLLTNTEKFKIYARQVINHCQAFIGRDKVYALFNEAIEAGYLLRETYKEKGLARVRYRISESAKFKKSLPRPENPDAVNPDAENQDSKGIASSTNKQLEDRAKAHSSEHPKPDCSKPPSINFSFETNRFENIETKDIASWKELYPTVDIDRELRAMTEWLMSNPQKAKKKLWRKFINNWLSGNNDRNVNREAARSRNYSSNEIDRRPRDNFGNVKPSQYAGVFQ